MTTPAPAIDPDRIDASFVDAYGEATALLEGRSPMPAPAARAAVLAAARRLAADLVKGEPASPPAWHAGGASPAATGLAEAGARGPAAATLMATASLVPPWAGQPGFVDTEGGPGSASMIELAIAKAEREEAERAFAARSAGRARPVAGAPATVPAPAPAPAAAAARVPTPPSATSATAPLPPPPTPARGPSFVAVGEPHGPHRPAASLPAAAAAEVAAAAPRAEAAATAPLAEAAAAAPEPAPPDLPVPMAEPWESDFAPTTVDEEPPISTRTGFDRTPPADDQPRPATSLPEPFPVADGLPTVVEDGTKAVDPVSAANAGRWRLPAIAACVLVVAAGIGWNYGVRHDLARSGLTDADPRPAAGDLPGAAPATAGAGTTGAHPAQGPATAASTATLPAAPALAADARTAAAGPGTSADGDTAVSRAVGQSPAAAEPATANSARGVPGTVYGRNGLPLPGRSPAVDAAIAAAQARADAFLSGGGGLPEPTRAGPGGARSPSPAPAPATTESPPPASPAPQQVATAAPSIAGPAAPYAPPRPPAADALARVEAASLRHAAQAGNVSEIRRILAEPGVAVDAADSGGRTALLHAVVAQRPGAVRALLSAGANPVRADRGGLTPRSAAEAGEDPEIARMFGLTTR